MTEEERRALPWYGGNKIPQSYLNKFKIKTEDDGLPYDLRLFLSGMGETRGANDGDTAERQDF